MVSRWNEDRFQSIDSAVADLVLYDMYSGEITQLTYHGREERVSRPCWSPDGNKIAYASGDGIHFI